jgi:hypothetical protein
MLIWLIRSCFFVFGLLCAFAFVSPEHLVSQVVSGLCLLLVGWLAFFLSCSDTSISVE